MTTKPHLHEKLGITFQELGALLGARNMLATGLVTETHYTSPHDENEHGFNMSAKCNKLGCGTVTCIGGLMALLMGVRPSAYVDETGNQGYIGSERCSPPLSKLFYPPQQLHDGWDWITPYIAVEAIDNFLNTGRPKWTELHAAHR